jgi:hypothetical protein
VGGAGGAAETDEVPGAAETGAGRAWKGDGDVLEVGAEDVSVGRRGRAQSVGAGPRFALPAASDAENL